MEVEKEAGGMPRRFDWTRMNIQERLGILEATGCISEDVVSEYRRRYDALNVEKGRLNRVGENTNEADKRAKEKNAFAYEILSEDIDRLKHSMEQEWNGKIVFVRVGKNKRKNNASHHNGHVKKHVNSDVMKDVPAPRKQEQTKQEAPKKPPPAKKREPEKTSSPPADESWAKEEPLQQFEVGAVEDEPKNPPKKTWPQKRNGEK